MSGTEFKLAQRPSLGKAGVSSQVNVNFFPITLKKEGTVHHYDVTITPEVPFQINKEVFSHFASQFSKDAKVLGGICVVFDGSKNAYAPRSLLFGTKFETELSLPERGGKPNAKNPRLFKIKLTKVNSIEVDVQAMHQRTPLGLTSLQAFNVLFRHQPNTKFVQIRDSFFINENVTPMVGGIEVWPGFFKSFLPGQDGLALNVDTIVCTFYRSGSLLDLITNFIGLRSVEELRDPRFYSMVKRIKSFLKNLRINLQYRDLGSREYKIRNVTDKSASSDKFKLVEDGIDKGLITVEKYFSQKLGVRLKFPELPCVEVKKGVLIPLELCHVIPGQRYTKKLDERQTSDMIKITCVPPKVRQEKIMAGFRMMAFDKNDYLKQFGITVEPKLKSVGSRILPVPQIFYHPSSRDKALRPIDGAWNLKDKKLFEGKGLRSWAVVVFANENRLNRRKVEEFLTEHISTCEATGMPVITKKPTINYFKPKTNLSQFMKDLFTKTGNQFKLKPQLFLCILPDKGAALYNDIKTVCEFELGMPTQCVQGDKVGRPNRQYCANVCLKMNAKLGGVNTSINPSELGDLKSPPTLLIGADVTHPSPGAIDAPSIAAAIGSIDFTGCRYASSVRVQHSRVEVITEFQAIVVDLLKAFRTSTNVPPARIIYFRDGVSEGQFQQVLAHEYRAILAACASLQKGYKPSVTFVVVQKRHHTRFFPVKQSDMDRSGNCKAGTVVETGICHPQYFDFYLQSHSGLQGTSRPVHYHVLIDEIKFSSDSLQKLCYNLCYLFARATRAVSLVPPVYYAHLAAARARAHYKIADGSDSFSEVSGGGSSETRSVHQELKKVMYYV